MVFIDYDSVIDVYYSTLQLLKIDFYGSDMILFSFDLSLRCFLSMS